MGLRKVFKEKIKALDKKNNTSLKTTNSTSTTTTNTNTEPNTQNTDKNDYQDLKKSVDAMRNELNVLLEKKKTELSTSSSAARNTNGSTTRKSTRQKKEEIPLTIEEKKKLSIGINSLTSSQLGVVVKIIKEKIPNIANDKEIEIDIASLDFNSS